MSESAYEARLHERALTKGKIIMRRIGVFGFAVCLGLGACGGDDSSNGNGTGASGGTGGGGGSSASGGSGGASGSGGSQASGGNASGGSSGGTASGGSASGGSGGSSAGSGGLGGSRGLGGSAGDAGGAGEAGMAGQGGAPDCEIGEAQSAAAPGTLDLFGEIAYFAGGDELPAGRYRVSYVDGCMKYASNQDWAIHAYEDGSIAWFLGASSSDKYLMLPGSVGYVVSNGGFSTFEECVAANLLLDPIEFDFAGGPLGIWLADTNYGDNVAGEDGRNPVWHLDRLGGCE